MKRSPRRRPKVEVSLSADSDLSATAWIIRSARSPYGPRQRWGQIEYAQAAICALYPKGLPRNFSPSLLTQDVRGQLAKDPDYCAVGFRKPVSRQTVLRAAELLRVANLSD